MKIKSVLFAFMWAVILTAFPVASGVIVVVSDADATSARLLQTAFMSLSVIVAFAYCKIKKVTLRKLLLKGLDKNGVRVCLFYIPLIVILLPMIATGVNLSGPGPGYIWATLLFTLSVGIAEELYFRGLILGLLRKAFAAVPAVLISALIFASCHASGAFLEPSMAMVLLSILNAFLFGCVAAGVALLTKNLIPLMIFHSLFDFFTYQMSATGTTLVIVYAARGTLMTIFAIYLLIALARQSKTAVTLNDPA